MTRLDVPHGDPVTEDTVFDLASLTKPMFTTAGAMVLTAMGEVDPDDQVSRFLPAWRWPTTIGDLLSHRSGLPWWRPFFREVEGGTRAERISGLRARLLDLEPTPTGEPVYSDPGFMLLGWVLEEVAGGWEALAELVEREVWLPMDVAPFWIGLDQDVRGPGVVPREQAIAEASFAATEDCPWRGRVLVAEVHDENAWFLRGVAPHAGLFGRARDVHGFGEAMLRVHLGERIGGLTPEVVRRFWTRPGPGTWALGWDTPTPGASTAGRFVSSSAVGHLGFTGTSLWIDPERLVVATLLTNRVHPTRHRSEGIRALRPELHDLLFRNTL